MVCAGDPSAAVFELETAPLAGADFSQMTLKHLLGLKEDGLLYDQPGTLQGATMAPENFVLRQCPTALQS